MYAAHDECALGVCGLMHMFSCVSMHVQALMCFFIMCMHVSVCYLCEDSVLVLETEGISGECRHFTSKSSLRFKKVLVHTWLGLILVVLAIKPEFQSVIIKRYKPTDVIRQLNGLQEKQSPHAAGQLNKFKQPSG